MAMDLPKQAPQSLPFQIKDLRGKLDEWARPKVLHRVKRCKKFLPFEVRGDAFERLIEMAFSD